MLRQLREYQWYQEAWQRGEDELAATKAQLHEEEERSWADDLNSKIKEEQAEKAAEKLYEALLKSEIYGSGETASLWSLHESKWVEFENALGDVDVGYDDIPWPPILVGVLSAMAALEMSKVKGQEGCKVKPTPKEAYAAHKRAFRKAHMRWHPDKFMHRFGKLIAAEDKEPVKEMVQKISQGVNQAWEEIEKVQ